MAHLTPSTSAACGGRLRGGLPDEMIKTKMFKPYEQVDFEVIIRPLNRGRSRVQLMGGPQRKHNCHQPYRLPCQLPEKQRQHL
jgi:hypothetical protein